MVFLQYGQIDVVDGAFVLINKLGVRTHIPIGSVACLMLEPGTRISHAATRLAAVSGTLLIWVGEAGVRLYAAGQPGGARSDRLLYQAQLALEPELRLKVVRKMFQLRFDEPAPSRRSVDQLRGIEGARVRAMYKAMASQFGIKWQGRRYDPKDWSRGDLLNRVISAANACVYGVTEAAVLAAGYAPAIGFLHSGKPLSFVYDIADLFKFEVTVPQAFKVAASGLRSDAERRVRIACRDAFRRSRLLDRIIPTITDVLAAGGIEPPPPPKDAVPPALPEPESLGDPGHRAA